MKRLLLAGILLALPILAADPALLNVVPADAKLVFGADMDRVLNSPFGQYALNLANLNDPGAQKFLEATGFDIRRDLREVLVATTGGADTALKDGALVAVRGTFDEGRLTALASVQGGLVSSYNGAKVISPGGAKTAGPWAAFLRADLMLAGEQDAVKAGIDRYRAGRSSSPALTARIQAATGRYDAWLVANLPPSALANRVDDPNLSGAMKGDLIQGIEDVMAGVRFGANVDLAAEATARSEKDATALVDVARFLLNMAASNSSRSGLSPVLSSLKMSAAGRQVSISVSIPESDFEKLLQAPKGRPVRVKPVVAR
jgi:hypothetical protein